MYSPSPIILSTDILYLSFANTWLVNSVILLNIIRRSLIIELARKFTWHQSFRSHWTAHNIYLSILTVKRGLNIKKNTEYVVCAKIQLLCEWEDILAGLL